RGSTGRGPAEGRVRSLVAACPCHAGVGPPEAGQRRRGAGRSREGGRARSGKHAVPGAARTGIRRGGQGDGSPEGAATTAGAVTAALRLTLPPGLRLHRPRRTGDGARPARGSRSGAHRGSVWRQGLFLVHAAAPASEVYGLAEEDEPGVTKRPQVSSVQICPKVCQGSFWSAGPVPGQDE